VPRWTLRGPACRFPRLSSGSAATVRRKCRAIPGDDGQMPSWMQLRRR
jgi:hypothetical protein